jgi:hypothetical protein
MKKQTFETRKNRKINKITSKIQLNIDMSSIDEDDIFGYYIMNRMEPSDVYGIPMIGDFSDIYPDYIALINHPNEFHSTNKTCIGWYVPDKVFDSIDGLYNAIIYKDIDLLKYYKWYLKDVKMVIGPDYSIYGNFKKCSIIHQMEKEAVVIGWMVLELGIVVYPNITYGLHNSFDLCFGNIYHGSNVALSLKGPLSKKVSENLLIDAIKTVVDKIEPKTIIVYTVSCDETTYMILEYAIIKRIKVLVVDNTLRTRNLRRLKSNG